MEYTFHYDSPLGDILLSSDGEALTGLWFEDQTVQNPPLHPMSEDSTESCIPSIEQAVQWLNIYFQGDIPAFPPPLHLHGTPFRKEVWKILLTIPYGHTISYGDIARQMAEQRGIPRMSSQAVGGAVGHNPVSLIVPCHRVIGTDGSLIGYGGGLWRKQELLQLESHRRHFSLS